MKIESVKLVNFRNYDSLLLGDLGNLVVFTGMNAVGKTNIIEGIHLLTTGKSFRNPQVVQLIKEGASSSKISMDCTDGNRMLEISVILEPGKKSFLLNGKRRNASEMRGLLPSVVFTPDDLEIAKKSSSVKRDAADDLGEQISKNYWTIRQDYEKVLKYKNRLLKDEASKALIESINETLIVCGTQLFCYRKALIERIVPEVERIYERISGGKEPFEALYIPSWEHLDDAKNEKKFSADAVYEKEFVRTMMRTNIDRYFEQERIRRRSLVGPHNDKVVFLLDGKDVSNFASQGQQRSVVLAWKLAEVEIIRQTLGHNPVLLLDDVMSELDEQRKKTLLGFVSEDIQTFITSTDDSFISEEYKGKALMVRLPLGGDENA